MPKKLPAPMPDPEPELDLEDSVLGTHLTWEHLSSLPPIEPLIDGWLDDRSTVVLAGETGTNKSFVALGWILSLAFGVPWLGHVTHGPVTSMLVVGEGRRGLLRRVQAWAESQDIEDEKMARVWNERVVPYANPELQLTDPELWDAVTAMALERNVRLVVMDTLSSLAPEMDETKDAPVVMRFMTDLADEIAGSVVLVHHAGWNDKGRVRGSSALEANPDGVVIAQKVEGEENLVSLWRKKNKDGEAGKRIGLRRVLAADSRVLDLADLPQAAGNARPGDLHGKVLEWLRDNPPVTRTSLLKQLGELHGGRGGIGRPQWTKALDEMLNRVPAKLILKKALVSEGNRGKKVERDVVIINPDVKVRMREQAQAEEVEEL